MSYFIQPGNGFSLSGRQAIVVPGAGSVTTVSIANSAATATDKVLLTFDIDAQPDLTVVSLPFVRAISPGFGYTVDIEVSNSGPEVTCYLTYGVIA